MCGNASLLMLGGCTTHTGMITSVTKQGREGLKRTVVWPMCHELCAAEPTDLRVHHLEKCNGGPSLPGFGQTSGSTKTLSACFGHTLDPTAIGQRCQMALRAAPAQAKRRLSSSATPASPQHPSLCTWRLGDIKAACACTLHAGNHARAVRQAQTGAKTLHEVSESPLRVCQCF